MKKRIPRRRRGTAKNNGLGTRSNERCLADRRLQETNAKPPAIGTAAATMEATSGGTDDHTTVEMDVTREETGRVVFESRGVCRIVAGEAAGGDLLTAELSGSLRHHRAEDPPVVGDWVTFSRREENRATILEVLPRRTVLGRKAAGGETRRQVLVANVDVVFVVMGLDNDFNLRRLERYLLMVRSGGAEPVVVLNKLDLAEDLAEQRMGSQEVAAGLAVVPVCALDGRGVVALESYLGPGVTAVFVGSSGAGKSTLVNRLAGREVMRTGAVRTSDERGRHTTTHRELISLPSGGLLIDTPGLRELEPWIEGDEALDQAFDEIAELSTSCRFRDCGHVSEPGCAVLEAVQTGVLDPARLEAFRRLGREIAAQERRRDEATRRKAERRQGAEYRRIIDGKKLNRGIN